MSNAEANRDPFALDPRGAYESLRARRAAEAGRFDRQNATIAGGRLVIFVAGAIVAWLALVSGSITAAWLLPPVLAFVALVIVHDRVIRREAAARRSVALWEEGLRRTDDQWAGRGVAGEHLIPPGHPCAEDLDLFGTGALFERLCLARTRAGEETLARWLVGQAAAPDEVRRRQAAVAELRDDLELRERLALAGADVRMGVNAEALRVWAAAPPRPLPPWLVPAAGAMGAFILLAATAWAAFGPALRPLFLLAALLAAALQLAFQLRWRSILRSVEGPAADLRLLVAVLALLERKTFRSPLLLELQRRLTAEGVPASAVFERLARLVEVSESLRNQLFAPIAFLLLVPLHLAERIERWRVAHGGRVVGWLEATGELEALVSLGAYAFERPSDTFPDLVPEGPRFVATGLGHPLIPEARRVANDVRLDADTCLLVVSGSNMSGKSTLLRAVGVNTVLGLAGAPVCAARLELSPMSIGATMRIHDSLRAGESRFYAEIRRVRAMMDLAAGDRPLLFLLDELLQGTNSHDRRVAAEAVVRSFLDRGAVGLISTHDLALAEIADALAPRAVNVHFQDDLTEDGLRFDYRLRPGVVTRSNALALMRSIGLEV
jgi:hypothetical protein